MTDVMANDGFYEQAHFVSCQNVATVMEPNEEKPQGCARSSIITHFLVSAVYFTLRGEKYFDKASNQVCVVAAGPRCLFRG